MKAERMNELPSISDAFLFVKNGVIAEFGKMSEIPNFGDIETINAKDISNLFVIKYRQLSL